MEIALLNQIIDQLTVFPLNPATYECYTVHFYFEQAKIQPP